MYASCETCWHIERKKMAITHILRNGVSTVLLLMALHATTHAQTAQQQQAQAREAQARALLAKYTASPGRDDTDGLLKELRCAPNCSV